MMLVNYIQMLFYTSKEFAPPPKPYGYGDNPGELRLRTRIAADADIQTQPLHFLHQDVE